jgi:threonine/homoserine/homoserine lactone efflux protein
VLSVDPGFQEDVRLTVSLQIIATLAAAQVVIAMAPGPDTLIVVHAGMRGRRLGLAAASGIWPVGLLFATLGLAGIGTVATALPEIAEAMRIACGLYLVWLGIEAIRRSFAEGDVGAALAPRPMTAGEALRAGTITNLMNPKSIAYYLSIFAATGASALGPTEQVIAVLMMPTISFLWYAALALLVAGRPVAAVADDGRSWLDRLAGLTMIGFGAKLLASRA